MDPRGPNPQQPVDARITPVTSSNTIAKVDGSQGPNVHHIWLVTGPAGCGKTTVAEHLATALNFPYIEGDSVSPVLQSPRYWLERGNFELADVARSTIRQPI